MPILTAPGFEGLATQLSDGVNVDFSPIELMDWPATFDFLHSRYGITFPQFSPQAVPHGIIHLSRAPVPSS